MVVVLLVALFGLGGLLLAFDTFALAVGITGLVGGEGLRRCGACGRWGMSDHGRVHADGCPAHHAHRLGRGGPRDQASAAPLR